MDSWSILNIKETRDKENIRQAYRTKLAVTNPEDDPEGFMKLREALEEALRFADSQDGSAADSDSCDRQDTDDSPVGRWIGQADELYRCFSKRIDPNQWEQLLQDDFCQNLDTKLLARDALLEYLTEHFFVPQCIMQTLDRYFDFRQNMKELEELFPQEFLDLLLVQRVQKKEYPPYESLEGDDSLPFDQSGDSSPI